jgi:hypothetical protein
VHNFPAALGTMVIFTHRPTGEGHGPDRKKRLSVGGRSCHPLAEATVANERSNGLAEDAVPNVPAEATALV